jgi:N-acetylglucosaminyl-diphospho-decaprenol L-rhamnosyltransferase
VSSRSAPSVAVVIVTHETRDEVLGCLSTLPDDVPTVVVDTGSCDGTAAAVRVAAPHATVLELANAGFGRGANAGVRATDADVVVVANADVRFADGAVGALARAVVASDDVALVGPHVVYPDGQRQASARALPDPLTAALHALLRWIRPHNRWTARYRQAGTDPALARDVGWVSGCVLAARRTAFDAAGGFDPGYALYLEDVDLAARLGDAGWRVRYDPVTTVVHRVGASTGTRRWRALRWHAAGLERFVVRRYGRAGRLLRLPLRAVLAAWVLVTYLTERTLGRGRSTTGE